MDYKGQELAELIYYFIILTFGVISWIVGYVFESFMFPVYGIAAAVTISVVLVVPDWPMFNRHPVKWLDQLPERKGVKSVGAAALKSNDVKSS